MDFNVIKGLLSSSNKYNNRNDGKAIKIKVIVNINNLDIKSYDMVVGSSCYIFSCSIQIN